MENILNTIKKKKFTNNKLFIARFFLIKNIYIINFINKYTKFK